MSHLLGSAARPKPAYPASSSAPSFFSPPELFLLLLWCFGRKRQTLKCFPLPVVRQIQVRTHRSGFRAPWMNSEGSPHSRRRYVPSGVFWSARSAVARSQPLRKQGRSSKSKSPAVEGMGRRCWGCFPPSISAAAEPSSAMQKSSNQQTGWMDGWMHGWIDHITGIIRTQNGVFCV